jgi:hypothetical protein
MKPRLRIAWFDRESLGIPRDELLIEVLGRRLILTDSGPMQFYDQSSLKRLIKPFATATRLRTIREDQLDAQPFHGNLKRRWLFVTLLSVNSTVTGRGELTRPIQIETAGQAPA